MKRVNNADINFVINPNYVNLANFTIKFYTTNEKYFYIEKNQDDVTTRERQTGVGGVDYIVKLDWSQLITIGKGVLNYKITNNYEDDDRADAEYNTSFERTSVYYIDSNVTVSEEEAESYAQVVAELGDRIDAEIVRSESADTEQSLALNTEIETRQNQVDIILNLIQDISGETDLSNYYTKDETYNKTATDELLSDKLDTTAYTPTDLSNYYTKDETYNKTEIDNAIADIDVTEQLKDYLTISSFTESEQALSGAIQTNRNDISALSNQIINEATNRENADSELSNKINAKLDISAYTPTDLSNYYTKSETSGATEISTALGGKQDTLVSATNIKTINNESILGSGNIDIQGGGKAVSGGTNISISTGETADTINCTLPISAGTGSNSIIMGNEANIASGNNSFAGGGGFTSFLKASATKDYAFAFGTQVSANGQYSAVFGSGNYVEANGAFASGYNNYIYGNYGVGFGQRVIGTNQSETSLGNFNVSNKSNTTFGDSGNTLFSVGNGTANNARHNAFEIRQNGDIYITSGSTDIKLQDHLGGGGSSTPIVILTESEYEQITKDENTVYIIK